MYFWDAAAALPTVSLFCLIIALLVAFAFEFINGFHDTANAVATVIYTRTLSPTPAVVFSGVMNFLGALLTVVFAGAAVAFSIVHLLPVDLLVDADARPGLVMVLALLLAGVGWNLGTWYMGLPVSSSHTLIGSILGVGMANRLYQGAGVTGVNWAKAGEVGLGLLLSPLVGFLAAGGLLIIMRRMVRDPRLYTPPTGNDRPPRWIRGLLIGTCGGVSFAHGSNDGQKGMGLLLLVLIGFMPVHYALSAVRPGLAKDAREGAAEVRAAYAEHGVPLPAALDEHTRHLAKQLDGKDSFHELKADKETRWSVRKAILQMTADMRKAEKDATLPPELRARLKDVRERKLTPGVEFIPVWVVVGTALALGIGTMIGYKRIVITVAEKIGKSHLTYGQGAAAQAVAAATILAADALHLPVSTTQILSSGVAGTMAANRSGLRGGTVRKILAAWLLTLPACAILAGLLFFLGRLIVG